MTLIKPFIPLFLVITAVYGTIYVTEQQILRQGANDPQIQISEDIATRLSTNPSLPPPITTKIDIRKSLNTFIIIFDDKNNPIFSTGKLNGTVPLPPSGVFDYTRLHKQDRITWQPGTGSEVVRVASVITRYSGKSSGFVLVGRSLREVEEREEDLVEHIGFAWIVTLIGYMIITKILSKKQK